MIWAYYISPFAWGVQAYAVNEMVTSKWNSQPYPDDPSLGLGTGALQAFGLRTGGQHTIQCHTIPYHVMYAMSYHTASYHMIPIPQHIIPCIPCFFETLPVFCVA